MNTYAYVFKKDKKYLWTFASYDEETFSDRNVFPIGCIKELKKIEIQQYEIRHKQGRKEETIRQTT